MAMLVSPADYYLAPHTKLSPCLREHAFIFFQANQSVMPGSWSELGVWASKRSRRWK